ncbi:hemin uptake protein HemP [Lutibaculum baratangense]|uniref:Hemin uptake protein HemP n=1 Tax=Lutibaculum baratangense AMV1 TaxID=631454 RepID=V4RL03_9HYPH|nr:hemin uptake protein HemP [Lutibaculum baratangense]ESR23890.1 hypothetical protein N177_2835 [Lutibaculum baratangense AMV1]
MLPRKPRDAAGDAEQATGEGRTGEPRVVRSDDLLGGCRQVVIVHNDEQYVLRLTRQGKLILNK